MKLPFSNERNSDKRFIDQYKELDNEEEIYEALSIKKETSLVKDLEESGYLPCAELTTIRRKYRKGEFVIDLDVLDFGYTIGEIEKMVEDETKVGKAIGEILRLAGEMA